MNKTPQTVSKDIARRMKQIRKSAHVTQQQMADLIGYSKNHISAVENAAHKPSAEMILGYCKALGITPNDLLGYSADIDPELLQLLQDITQAQQKQIADIVKNYK